MKTVALVAKTKGGELHPEEIDLRELRPNDVHIEVEYCGVCHTDLHYIGDEWGNSFYPCVPGHEVVGIAKEIGSDVDRIKVGDRVGLGYICWSCRKCEECETDRENYCDNIVTTLSGKMPDGEITKGGWARDVVAPQEFIVVIPKNLDASKAAPLLCAGVTVFSPMRRWAMDKKGTKIGVVGMGGLGHLAVMFGVAMGAEVTVMDIFPEKEEIARKLGAKNYINSKDPQEMAKNQRTLNYIIDTAPSAKPIEPFLELLKTDGMIINIGLPNKEFKIQIPPATLSFKRRGIQGTLTGSVEETQAMFNFAGEHNVVPWVEVVEADQLDEAMERMVKGDVRFRFVIDVKNTLHLPHITSPKKVPTCRGTWPWNE